MLCRRCHCPLSADAFHPALGRLGCHAPRAASSRRCPLPAAAAAVVARQQEGSAGDAAVAALPVVQGGAAAADLRSAGNGGGGAHAAEGFDSIESALEALSRGEFVVVLDDEDRENEGDLIMAAEKVLAAITCWAVDHLPNHVPNSRFSGLSADMKLGYSLRMTRCMRSCTLSKASLIPDLDRGSPQRSRMSVAHAGIPNEPVLLCGAGDPRGRGVHAQAHQRLHLRGHGGRQIRRAGAAAHGRQRGQRGGHVHRFHRECVRVPGLGGVDTRNHTDCHKHQTMLSGLLSSLCAMVGLAHAGATLRSVPC